MLSTVLGLAPLVVGGKPEQHQRFLPPFLRPRVHRLAAFARPNPAAAPTSDLYRQEKASAPPRGGFGRLVGHLGPGSMDICGHGWNGQGADLLTSSAAPMPTSNLAWHLDHRCASSRQRPDFEHRIRTCWTTLPILHAALPHWDAVQVPAGRFLLGQEGGGLPTGCGRALRCALSSVSSVSLMRAALSALLLSFAKSEEAWRHASRSCQHQAVGYALADAKTTIEAARVLSWHAWPRARIRCARRTRARYPR